MLWAVILLVCLAVIVALLLVAAVILRLPHWHDPLD